jgi:hypothetical protein
MWHKPSYCHSPLDTLKEQADITRTSICLPLLTQQRWIGVHHCQTAARRRKKGSRSACSVLHMFTLTNLSMHAVTAAASTASYTLELVSALCVSSLDPAGRGPGDRGVSFTTQISESLWLPVVRLPSTKPSRDATNATTITIRMLICCLASLRS